MCLILFAWRSHPQYRLLVAANRDEFYNRPAAAAHWWQDAPHILAGRDLSQGGTWLGITRSGRFAALTNIRNPQAQPGELSRGALVKNFLCSTQTLAQFGETLLAQSVHYSPFNLLTGDGEQLYYGNSLGEWRALMPGVYGLSNGLLDAPWPKVLNGKQQLLAMLAGEVSATGLLALLADRQQANDETLPDTGIDRALEKKLSSRFIHFEGYGTRCSTALLVNNAGHVDFHEREFDEQGRSVQTRQHAWNTNHIKPVD